MATRIGIHHGLLRLAGRGLASELRHPVRALRSVALAIALCVSLSLVGYCQIPLLDPPGIPTLEYRHPIPELESRTVGRPSVADVSTPKIELWTNSGVTYQRSYRSNEPWKPYNRAGVVTNPTTLQFSSGRPGLYSAPRSARPFPAAIRQRTMGLPSQWTMGRLRSASAGSPAYCPSGAG